jgi:hypothetical protein
MYILLLYCEFAIYSRREKILFTEYTMKGRMKVILHSKDRNYIAVREVLVLSTWNSIVIV